MRGQDGANQPRANDQGAGEEPKESAGSDQPAHEPKSREPVELGGIIGLIGSVIAAVAAVQGIINGANILRTLGVCLLIGAITAVGFTAFGGGAGRKRRAEFLCLAICMVIGGVAAVAVPQFTRGSASAARSSTPDRERLAPGASPSPEPGRTAPGIVGKPSSNPVATALVANPAVNQVVTAGSPGASIAPNEGGSTAPATAGSGTVPPSRPASTANPQPTPSAGEERNHGSLTLEPGQAADLDSEVQGNWEVGGGSWTQANGYNIGYSGSSLSFSGGPSKWAAMGAAGGWNYDSCRDNTPYGNGSAIDGGAAFGSEISGQHGICYQTSGGNQALLVVQSQSASSITLSVIVWQD
jgi:hypothetical protein